MPARVLRTAAALLLAAGASGALACSPKPGWKPPTAAEAFDAAAVVVHAKVAAVEARGLDSVATLADPRVLKGEAVAQVRTTSGAMCGIGGFEAGREYVFFLPGPQAPVVFLQQPRERDPARVLDDLRAAGKIR